MVSLIGDVVVRILIFGCLRSFSFMPDMREICRKDLPEMQPLPDTIPKMEL
jgi:hypothetical protein